MPRRAFRMRHGDAKSTTTCSRSNSSSHSDQTTSQKGFTGKAGTRRVPRQFSLQLTSRKVALTTLVVTVLYSISGQRPLLAILSINQNTGRSDRGMRWSPELCVRRNRGSTSKCRLEPCRQKRNSTTSQINYGTGKVIRRYKNVLGQNKVVLPLHMGQAAHQSGCLLSRKYKFVWVHVLKSGGNTMRIVLPESLCGNRTCDDKDVLDYVDCEYAFTNFPQFLTFSFIRNPYSRYYSAISMANLPHYLLLDHPLDIESFAKASEAAKKNMTSLPLPHFFPQSIHLFDQNDCPVFDVLGRLEYAEEDYQYIMSLIGSPELWDYYRQKGLGSVFNVGSLTKGDNFSLPETLQSPIVRATIRKDYEVDFAHFGMDPFTIPPR